MADPVPRCPSCTGESHSGGLCAPCLLVDLGISYRQLDYWVRQGWLRPERDRRGTGVPRRWPEAELAVARRMVRLTAAGFPPALAHRFARDLWPDGEIAPGIWISAEEIRDA